MGSAFSRTEPFETNCTSADIKRNIQAKLEQLPEYKSYSITLLSTQTPSDTANTCDVEYNAKNIKSTEVVRDVRRVALTTNGQVDVIGTARSGLSYITPRPTKQAVYDYYAQLARYNYGWNSGGWRAAIGTSPTYYNPPLPSWSDPVFARNIGIYNDNLKRALATGGAFDANTHTTILPTEYQTRFQKYVAVTPGAPSPPDLSDVLLEVDETVMGQEPRPSATDIANGSAPDVQAANAAANATVTGRNLQTYDSLMKDYRNTSDYDPPREGDSYEVLLMKFNKAYDVVAGRRSGSMDMASASEQRSDWYKRFIGRGLDLVFPIPEATVPITTPLKDETIKYNYRPHEFSARQKEIINYCPVDDGSDQQALIKANFCKSLGFHVPEDKTENLCGAGEMCCIPLAPTPAYEEPRAGSARPSAAAAEIPPGYTRLNPYTPASILAGVGDFATNYGPVSLTGGPQIRKPPPAKKTASACPGPKEYTVRSKTYVVQLPPTRSQNAKKSLEYIMSKPVGSCDTKPAVSKEGFVSMDSGTLMKGQQQEENSKKMAALRGFGY